MLDKIIRILKDFIYGISFLFAIGSSVYCLNLVFKHYIDPNSDFIVFALFICLFFLGISINKHKEDIEKQNNIIKNNTMKTLLNIHNIKEKEEQ